jgi:protoporphyrinogen oxidase
VNTEDRAQDPQTMPTLDSDVLVIGAGLSGLTAAFDLVENGRTVLLVESSAAHGGYLTCLTASSARTVAGSARSFREPPEGLNFASSR